MADLLPLEEAQARLLALRAPLEPVAVPLVAAAGRWLASDMQARLTHPPADVSAMDGWAIRFADLPGPFREAGEAAAGGAFARELGPGEAVRIFTGAPVPKGADTIVVQEEMALADGCLVLSGAGPDAPGRHVRRRGQDVAAGAPLARAGARIAPPLLGLLAAAGHAAIPVRRRPRVALLATGSELVPPGVVPAAGQIVSSNGVMLAALAQTAGAEVRDCGIVPDDPAATSAAIRAAASGADVLVTIGGASVGVHDLVRPALLAQGGRIDFWRIALRPGKPLLAGQLGEALVLGLPGNPVSAFVCALLFLLPLLRHLGGDPEPLPRLRRGLAGADLAANGPRRTFLRARLGEEAGLPVVTPAGVQDSAMLSVLAACDALLVRPEHAPAAARGSEVWFLTY